MQIKLLKVRDELGNQVPIDVHEWFELALGANIGDFAMGLCGIAKSVQWPVAGRFNGKSLTAWPASSPEDLLIQYWDAQLRTLNELRNAVEKLIWREESGGLQFCRFCTREKGEGHRPDCHAVKAMAGRAI